MSLTVNYVLSRADITRATQEQLVAVWVWARKTVAQWVAAVAAIRTQRDVVVGSKRRLTMALAETDEALDDLHEMMVQGVGMARAFYSRNESVLRTLSLLHARGRDRQEILDEAAAWEAAWGELPDEDWAAHACQHEARVHSSPHVGSAEDGRPQYRHRCGTGGSEEAE